MVPAPQHSDLLLDHPVPWTEEAFLTLPHDPRVELLDGSLLVSPASTNLHQWLSFQLCAVLNAAAPRGLRALPAVNVRVGSSKILIPDVVVLSEPSLPDLVNPASAVQLVVEITSPGNAFVDRGLKPQLYAQAGIERYLRVELASGEPCSLVFILDGDRYIQVDRFAPGEMTRLTEPFRVEFDLATLASTS